ncbi:MAG TPA: hypothetical protein DIT99_02180 [Candidatus Latescibacteria bacterium]|mgnify:FL=1|nr:hypothetical protein [Candidatus Latescibacterota bacterium]
MIAGIILLGRYVISPLIAVVALSMAATLLLMVCHEKLIQPRVGARESEDRDAGWDITSLRKEFGDADT